VRRTYARFEGIVYMNFRYIILETTFFSGCVGDSVLYAPGETLGETCFCRVCDSNLFTC